MNPLESGQILSSSLPSEQVTPSVRPALVLSEQRSIPPVVVIHPALVGGECVRPSSNNSGFEGSRLPLRRLEVLAAALQQVEELQCMAANAPEGRQ
jgi:hypothetical protein